MRSWFLFGCTALAAMIVTTRAQIGLSFGDVVSIGALAATLGIEAVIWAAGWIYDHSSRARALADARAVLEVEQQARRRRAQGF